MFTFRGAMTIRRRASANSNPSNSPLGVSRSSPPESDEKTRIKKVRSQRFKAQRPSPRTLKLEAGGANAFTDPTLQDLLQIKPPSLANENENGKSQATAERVEEAKEALGKLESEIVSALFPSTGLPASLEDVAQRLGMTVKEVRDVADNALRGLRGTKSSRPRLSTVWN